MTDHFNDKQNTAERFLDRDGLSFVVFPALEETGLVRHGFATRKGGVSRGCFESLNLSYARGDDARRYGNRLADSHIKYPQDR